MEQLPPLAHKGSETDRFAIEDTNARSKDSESDSTMSMPSHETDRFAIEDITLRKISLKEPGLSSQSMGSWRGMSSKEFESKSMSIGGAMVAKSTIRRERAHDQPVNKLLFACDFSDESSVSILKAAEGECLVVVSTPTSVQC